jgi:hypothetical protein
LPNKLDEKQNRYEIQSLKDLIGYWCSIEYMDYQLIQNMCKVIVNQLPVYVKSREEEKEDDEEDTWYEYTPDW